MNVGVCVCVCVCVCVSVCEKITENCGWISVFRVDEVSKYVSK